MARTEVDRLFGRFPTGADELVGAISAQADALLRKFQAGLDQFAGLEGEPAVKPREETPYRRLVSIGAVQAEIDQQSSWNESMRNAAARYLVEWDDNAPGLVNRRSREEYEKHDAHARKVVDNLFDELTFTDEVIAAIERADDANEALRNASQACARLRVCTPETVYADVWKTVVGNVPSPRFSLPAISSDADLSAMAENAAARHREPVAPLQRAQALSQREPENHKFTRLLALVQLKAEEPDKALKTLGTVPANDLHGLAVQLLAYLALGDEKKVNQTAKLLRASSSWRANHQDEELAEIRVLLNYKLASSYQEAKELYGKRQWSAAAARFSKAFCLGDTDPIHLGLWASSLQSSGKVGEAAAMYGRAIGIQENLVREYPTVAEYQSGLALSYQNLAVAQMALKQQEQSTASYQKAIDIYAKLVREEPTEVAYRRSLTGIYYSFANQRSAVGSKGDAATLRQKAIDLQEQLAREHFAEPQYQGELASSYVGLALQQSLADDKLASLASLRRAVEVFDRLKESAPKNQAWVQGADLARVGILMLWAFDQVGDRDEITTIVAAIRKHKLADTNSMVTLGATLYRLGQYDEAEDFLKKGLAVASVPVRFQKNAAPTLRAYVAIAELLTAMNEERRGNSQQAQALLVSATSNIKTVREQVGKDGKIPRRVANGIDVDALLNEAEALLKTSGPSSNAGALDEATKNMPTN